jgi:phosphoenolpyruvate carboxykinase (GTP)
VFVGASLSSEMTAAAKGVIGKLRHDPFSMLAFCGYNMGDYFAHWVEMGRKGAADKLPKIYSVNWFRKGADGRFVWPGFGDNARVLKWIFERTSGSDNGKKTAIGIVPETLDWSGLELTPEAKEVLFRIDPIEWLKESQELENYFALFGDKFPKELALELEQLKKRLR